MSSDHLAESLLKSVSRAFFPDSSVSLLDVLIRDKYLRDDEDMEARLKLPAKEIRQTVTFLRQQSLVYEESVDDLETGGSRQTSFYYIDYYRAVQVISLRIHLLFRQIQDRESQARGSGNYQCPNYAKGQCNGVYSLLQAQNCVDFNTKMFLCAHCQHLNSTSLSPADPKTYELVPIDDKEELQRAMRDMAKVREQLGEAKFPGTDKLMRPGVMELLQRVSGAKLWRSQVVAERFWRRKEQTSLRALPSRSAFSLCLLYSFLYSFSLQLSL